MGRMSELHLLACEGNEEAIALANQVSPGFAGQPEPEEAEEAGEAKPKNPEITVDEVDGIDSRDYPDFCDAYVSAAHYTETGVELDDKALDELNDTQPELAHEWAMEAVLEG